MSTQSIGALDFIGQGLLRELQGLDVGAYLRKLIDGIRFLFHVVVLVFEINCNLESSGQSDDGGSKAVSHHAYRDGSGQLDRVREGKLNLNRVDKVIDEVHVLFTALIDCMHIIALQLILYSAQVTLWHTHSR